MIDFSKVKDLTIPLRGGRYPVVKIESGGTVLWMHDSLIPISLEVKKVQSYTNTYGSETNIRLGIYVGYGTPVKVTYGGLTKVVDFSGSVAQTVYFGTYKGVADEMDTPESGTLTIEGSCFAVVASTPCVTGINNWGKINRVEYEGFRNCKELDIDYIPEGVTQISDNAFYGCTAITEMRIPSTVEEIRSYAFAQCSNLATVRIEATTPPEAGTKIFNNASANLQIIVPAGCGEAYRTASGWSTYADRIVEAAETGSAASRMLLSILRNDVYSTNQAANITALEAELSDGMTATASSLLIEILRNGVYSADPSADIDALCAELGVVENEPV